ARENLPAVQRTIAILAAAGRHPVHVKRDIPGFIGNRLQHAIKREAIALVADGICDAETIDDVVKMGFGKRMAVLGPMEQSDLVGLDLTRAIHEVLLSDLDTSGAPHPYLVDLVEAGKTGMNAGQGLRKWTQAEADAVRDRLRDFLAAEAKTS
ncbi:MAG: 3-hydroxyacyl-CoA dehydrogenase family protein, partial [Rhodospirillaceae bacterium]|nr:3-hydroxyacyl-CoA dehydrogenase family protein [Rhodospirillaceae bacterium]